MRDRSAGRVAGRVVYLDLPSIVARVHSAPDRTRMPWSPPAGHEFHRTTVAVHQRAAS